MARNLLQILLFREKNKILLNIYRNMLNNILFEVKMLLNKQESD